MSVISLLGAEKKIKFLLSEFKRILKPRGKIIIDINDHSNILGIWASYSDIANNSINYINGGEGYLRGTYNAVYPASSGTSPCYGTYNLVGTGGQGTHYGGYFSASGAGNYGIYSYNTTAGGFAGHFEGDVNHHCRC